MASKRPAFARVDTDHSAVPMDTLSPNGEGSSKKYWHEEDGTDMKGAHQVGVAEISEGTTDNIYNVEAENHFGQGEVVTTALDVVTRELHRLLGIDTSTDESHRRSPRRR